MSEKISRITEARLPPLNAIRAFAAAGRHASLTLAASELGVSPGAVSRQVKLLEEHLGAKLFIRAVRQISLTAAGRDLLTSVVPALERIAAAATAITRAPPHRVLRINVRPSFAVRWLISHLPKFLGAHPDIEPQVVTSTIEPRRIGREGFDIAIRRGQHGWPADMKVRPFLSEWVAPVASPALLRERPIRNAMDLARHTIIHCATRDGDWQQWLALAGAKNFTPIGVLRFEHLQFTLQAAVDGLGIALGPSALIAQDIAAMRLVAPLPTPHLKLEDYYYGVSDSTNTAALAFATWLDSLGLRVPSKKRDRPHVRTGSAAKHSFSR
jgi:LysR family transcriptional regulator, glycine cleavage system transcriptional activator